MHERDDFHHRSTVREGLPDSGDYGQTSRTKLNSGVLLHEADGLLRVVLVVTPFGMPHRWRRPPAVHLAHGQWLRWQANYRYADANGNWSYRLDTLNISHGQAPADLFLGTPTRNVNELATLG